MYNIEGVAWAGMNVRPGQTTDCRQSPWDAFLAQLDHLSYGVLIGFLLGALLFHMIGFLIGFLVYRRDPQNIKKKAFFCISWLLGKASLLGAYITYIVNIHQIAKDRKDDPPVWVTVLEIVTSCLFSVGLCIESIWNTHELTEHALLPWIKVGFIQLGRGILWFLRKIGTGFMWTCRKIGWTYHKLDAGFRWTGRQLTNFFTRIC